MKTQEEIKRELEEGIRVHYHISDIEPRLTPLALRDLEFLHDDALAIIQRLEATVSEKEKVVAELSGIIGQLEAERNQLLEKIEMLETNSEE